MTFSLHPGDLAFGGALLFLFGVFVVSLGWNLYIFLIVTLFASAILLFFKKRLWRECAVFLALLLVGAFYYHWHLNSQAAKTNLPFGEKISFLIIVSDEPQPSDKFLILRASAEPPLWGTVKILAPRGSTVSYGDLLRVEGIINRPDTDTGDPVVFSPKIELLAAHRGFWLREWMIDLKLSILEKFNEILPADHAALLGGITFGSKQNFKPELKKAMALSGLTHLVAVSGYNITIVILAVGGLFSRFFSRRVTFYFAIAFLILFMFMVGGAASGVRAAIMGFLALVAREVGQMFSMRNAITLTAAIMVLFDPTALTQSMSFVLSYLSLLGIVYIGPPLRKLLRSSENVDRSNGSSNGGPRGDGPSGNAPSGGIFEWKENAVTTLSAQLAVMPVLMNAFGQFSATAIIANVLVLGTVPLTMFFGFLLAVLGFLSRYLAFFVGKLAGLLLGYQLSVIKLFAALAVPLPLPLNSQFAMFFYYLILAAFVFSYSNFFHKDASRTSQH